MKNEKERNEYNELLEKYQFLSSQRSNNENDDDFNNQKNIKSCSDLLNEKKIADIKKRLPTINAYEVEPIGTEIKYALLLKRIPFSEIENVFSF